MSEKKKLTQFYIEEELYEALTDFKEKNNIRSMTSTIKSALNDYFFGKNPSNVKEYNYRTVFVNEEFYNIFKMSTINPKTTVMDYMSDCILRFHTRFVVNADDNSIDTVESLTRKTETQNKQLTIAIKTKDQKLIDEIMTKYNLDLHQVINGLIVSHISMSI